MLEVDLLGPPRLLLDGEPTSVDTRKAIAVLSYLAVEGATTRNSLVGLLWPESTEARAKGTLRRTLSALRSAMGPEIIVADRSRISAAPRLSSDLARFTAAIAATTEHKHDAIEVCELCLPHLERALAEYTGDFLEGFHVRGAAEFDDWSRTVAEGLRLECGRVAERLSVGRAAHGDFTGAIEACQRWVALDLLHEPAHRYLMLLYGWAGDRSGAIAAYRRCVAVLDQELGIEPLEETTELYEAILDEDLPPAPGMRRRIKPRPPAQITTSPDLIDRKSELEVMHTTLDEVAHEGQLVVISGETWTGKTRMLEALTTMGRNRSFRVLSARGYRGEQSLPFGVAVQLLRSGRKDAARSERLPAWAAAELSRLLPDLARSGDDLVEPPAAPDAWGEARLFDALVLAVMDADKAPTLVAVDDVDWADAASLSFLAYLAHRLRSYRVVLAVAHAGREAHEDESLAELIRQDPRHSIELHPLTTYDLQPLLGDPARAGRIIRNTGGIPLLVAAAMRDAEADLTSSVRAFLQDRLRRLGQLPNQVLAAAAVLGASSSTIHLRATSGRGSAEIVEAVEHLVRSGILRETEEPEGVEFALGTARQIVYDDTSPVRRQLLHSRAASAMAEELHAASAARTAAAVAYHYRKGGLVDDAADWYFRAGDLARQQFAYHEAEEAYRTALAVGAQPAALLHLAIGDLDLLTGHHQQALAEFQIAAATAEASEAAVAEHRIGEVHRRLGHFDLAARHFELSEPDHPEPWSLYADWALLLTRLGRSTEAAGMGKKSVAAAEASTDPNAPSRSRNVLGIVTADDEEAEAHLRRALELAKDDPVLRMAALNSLAYRIGHSAHPDDAADLISEALGLAQQIGDRHREAALHNHLADLHHVAGRTEESERALMEAVRLFADLEPSKLEPELWLLAQW